MRVLFLTNNENTFSLVEFIRKTDDVIVFNEKLNLETVQELNPDFIVSYNYRSIIHRDVIEWMSGGIINLHASLLPWNKGSYPNLWSIIEDTPKGVTIHYISEGLDEGEIILQKQVEINEESESLLSSYELLHKEMQMLFMVHWQELKYHKILSSKQMGEGSKHSTADTAKYLELITDWNISISQFKALAKGLVDKEER